jgi:L-aminopeptidase/D-esterase-like protein
MAGMFVVAEDAALQGTTGVASLLFGLGPTEAAILAVLVVSEIAMTVGAVRWCWRRLRGWHERRKSTRRKDRNP